MTNSLSETSSIRNEDLLALQSYVTANDATQYSNLAQTTLLLDLTHSNLVQRHIEIRFDLHQTISSLRNIIHQKTGTAPHHQHLQFLYMNTVMVDIPPETDSERKLGYYSLHHGTVVHCIDVNPHSASKGGGYEDTSLVKKYVMSDEEYDKRRGTLRDWEREQKKRDANFSLAKHAKEHREMMEAKRLAKVGMPLPPGFELDEKGEVVRMEPEEVVVTKKEKEEGGDTVVDALHGQESVQGIEVGMRCQVCPGERRGSVAYVGVVPEIGGGGHWVGVIFDEPVGKTDGTAGGKGGIGGKRYFDAPGSNYGGFVRGKNVEVGNFPERDIMDELDDSSSEDEL